MKALLPIDIQNDFLPSGDEELVEAAPADYFWGIGKAGTGQNWLGKILMEVRAELRSSSSQQTGMKS